MTYATIVDNGQGSCGFLAPPGDPAHRYAVVEKSSNRSNARELGYYSLASATDGSADWLPEHIRRRAAKIIAGAQRVESDRWVRSVYGYFRNTWTPDGRPWESVTSLVFTRPDSAPDDWHAAVVYIRRYFPEHTIRAELITDPGKGYGSWPCGKCGQRVQYEARHDALAVVRTSGGLITGHDTVCPAGGQHEHD